MCYIEKYLSTKFFVKTKQDSNSDSYTEGSEHFVIRAGSEGRPTEIQIPGMFNKTRG